jgi:Tfp pilus assembly protein PilF
MLIKRNNRIKTTFSQKTILIIFGLFLALVILETGLRLGGFIILSLQERRNLLSIKQRGEYRIMCLGESTTQGEYPSYLGEILNKHNIGVKFSVIDKGLIGTETGFIVSQLEANLDKYQPDLVVTMMGINDYEGRLPYKTGSSGQVMRFFKSFKTYKLMMLLIKQENNLVSDLGLGFQKDMVDPELVWLYYLRQGKLAEAEELLKKAIEIGAQKDMAYTHLAWLYITQGKYAEAEQLYKKAIELNPRNSQAPTELGVFYVTQGKLAEAEQLFKKTTEFYPQKDIADSGLAWLYITQGKYAEAEQLFKEAIKVGSQRNLAYAGLGWLYMTQGKLTAAEQLFKKAVEFGLHTDLAYGSLAVIYGEMGNHILRNEYEARAEQIRNKFYNPVTVNNYHRFKQILDRRKVEWVCAQYPMRSIEPLKKIMEGEKRVFFVDNEATFKNAVLKEGYKAYFRDIFGGDFGHCTEKGNKLLAENIANTILKEIFRR